MAPIYVGRCGLIYLRCVGIANNDATRWLHKVSSTWTGVYRFIRRPFAVLSACWRRVNVPAAPSTVGTVLHRVPSSLFQHRRYRWLTLVWMVLSRESRLLLLSFGRVSTLLTVSIAHPSTTFCMLRAASPLRSFLREIGSSLAVSSLSLGRKRSSMARNRCHVICRLLVGPP